MVLLMIYPLKSRTVAVSYTHLSHQMRSEEDGVGDGIDLAVSLQPQGAYQGQRDESHHHGNGVYRGVDQRGVEVALYGENDLVVVYPHETLCGVHDGDVEQAQICLLYTSDKHY